MGELPGGFFQQQAFLWLGQIDPPSLVRQDNRVKIGMISVAKCGLAGLAPATIPAISHS